MGNASNAGIRIANQTELPMVFVISQVGPLYWGVLQPGERATRHTGRVHFTVTAYPYDGSNEPTKWQAVQGPLLVAFAAIAVVAPGGAAAVAATPAAGTAAAALAPICTSPAVTGFMAAGVAAPGIISAAGSASKFLEQKLTHICEPVEKKGRLANGDWLHIRGGPKRDQSPVDWQKLYFCD